MRYLLDVNVLLALALDEHEFHSPVAAWVKRLAEKGVPELATCSITELGFVRVLGQSQAYGFSVMRARELLMALKKSNRVQFSFVTDDHDISRLPNWVKSSTQTRDGHLLALAMANEATLATLDRKIPGALVIPQGR